MGANSRDKIFFALSILVNIPVKTIEEAAHWSSVFAAADSQGRVLMFNTPEGGLRP